MTTIRQAHHKKYVSITNKLAQNNSLSLKARGLMLYLLSLPDDWEVHVNHLVNVCGEGRNTILSILKELKAARYVRMEKFGFQGKVEYLVFEEPIDDEGFKKFLQSNRFLNSLNSKQFTKQHLQSTKEREKGPKKDTKLLLLTRAGAPERKKISREIKKEKVFEISQEQLEAFDTYCTSEKKSLDPRFVKKWMRLYGEEKMLQAFDYLIQQEKMGYKIKNLPGLMIHTLKESPDISLECSGE
jgi:hypothetical protein